MKEACFENTEEEVYDKKCGEVFLTLMGNIVFQCILCESKCNKFNGFDEYAVHIQEIHVSAYALANENTSTEEVNIDPLAPADLCLQVLQENEFAIDELKGHRRTVEILPEPEIVDLEKAKESTHLESTKPNSDSTLDFGKILESVDLQIKKKRYKRENRKHKCPHCDFAAKDSTNLTYHVRRHSDYKPHKCTDCDRGFYTKSELNTHRRTHTGERPFLCTDCGRAFMTSGMLSDHVKRHKNLREKECAVCKMKFYSAKQLRAHIVVHSDDRLHRCLECDKGFKQRKI